jgi:hypothetical protein
MFKIFFDFLTRFWLFWLKRYKKDCFVFCVCYVRVGPVTWWWYEVIGPPKKVEFTGLVR